MSWDGDVHHFAPAPVVGHTPELPYLGLFEVLETVYAYSQESARIVYLHQFGDARRRGLAMLEACTIYNAAAGKTLFHQSSIALPEPTDMLTALLGFRTNFGAVTDVGLTLTVNTAEATETILTTPDETGKPIQMAGDRDVLDLHIVGSSLDVTSETLSSALLKVVVTTINPILPEWVMIVRSA